MYVPQLLYPRQWIFPSVSGHLGGFHVLAIVKSTTVNTGVHVPFSILVSSGYMPSGGIAGSYGRFIPMFLRTLHTVFPEKAMAPHSSTLAWKIPWTEEPGRLHSRGSLGVGHD